MKYFIVSDVYGFYSELQPALKIAGFDSNNKDHIFIFIVDLVDIRS